MDFFRCQFPNTSIIPKQHFLEKHVTARMENWGFGMALHGEQGGEQMHAVINRMRSTAWGIRTDSGRLRHLMTEHLLLVTPDLSVPVPMPVEGLPSNLEGAMSALIKGNPLTSFKVDGRGDNIVVVLRFSTGQPNDTATRRYRLKPPSQQARDERRADIRQGQVRNDSSPTPLFMPTPPGQLTEKPQELGPMTSDLTGLHACL